MLSCKETTGLVSQSMDGPLPWRRRMAMWLHLSMCRYCSRFARQLRLLRATARREEAPDDVPEDARLDDGARARLREALRRETEGES